MKYTYTNSTVGITSRTVASTGSEGIIYYIAQASPITGKCSDQKILIEVMEKFVNSLKDRGFKIPEDPIIEVYEGVNSSFDEVLQFIRVPVFVENKSPVRPKTNFFDKHSLN